MDVLAELDEVIDGLAGVDPVGLSDAELGAVLVGLRRAKNRLVAVEARLTAVFEARGGHRADGSKTAAMWLGRHTKASLGSCRAQVRLARRLEAMPHTWAALAAGEIDEHHARILGELAGSTRPLVAEGFTDAEASLVAEARTLRFQDFVRAVRTWENQVDADGGEDQARRDRQARRLQLHQSDRGTWTLSGHLDAIAGTELATALQRVERELFQADWAAAKELHGKDTTVEHLARTGLQRRADALVELTRRAMAAPPGARVPEPLVTVLVGYETFAGPTCELLNNGTLITPGQVASLLTRADIERAVFDGPNRIIELGVRKRFFTGGLRRAIEIRDRHCTHPGCDTPYQCEVDHIVPYSQDGPTTQGNGRLHCHRHNQDRNNQERNKREHSNPGRRDRERNNGERRNRGRKRRQRKHEPASGDPP